MFRRQRKTPRRQPDPSADSRSPVFSYYSNRSADETNTSGRHEDSVKKRRNWSRIPATILTILILAGVVYLLTLSAKPKVVALSSNGVNLLRNTSAYQQAAEEILGSSVLNRTKITIDSNGFERRMKQKFPELQSAVVTLPLVGRTPVVELQASQPALILSGKFGDYVLDINGKAVIKTANVTGLDQLKLTRIQDQSDVPIILSRGVLTTQNVTFINTVLAQLEAQKETVQSITLPAVANELRIQLKDQPYYVKFDMQNDPKLSAGTLLAVKKKLAADHVTPAEYIDARVEERVYYK